jgi:hypothetical protein
MRSHQLYQCCGCIANFFRPVVPLKFLYEFLSLSLCFSLSSDLFYLPPAPVSFACLP